MKIFYFHSCYRKIFFNLQNFNSNEARKTVSTEFGKICLIIIHLIVRVFYGLIFDV